MYIDVQVPEPPICTTLDFVIRWSTVRCTWTCSH